MSLTPNRVFPKIFVLAVLPGIALSVAACKGQPNTPEGRMAHQRHENFEDIGDAFKGITDELKKTSPDTDAIRIHAGVIDSLAPKVGTWFPKGTGPNDGVRTDALETVWTRPQQFQQAATRFADASAHFKLQAKANDIPALRKAAGELGGACKNCHDTFREKD
jgi:cytochrome c556